MRVEARQGPGEENYFMIGEQKFRKEKRKQEQDWVERKRDKAKLAI